MTFGNVCSGRDVTGVIGNPTWRNCLVPALGGNELFLAQGPTTPVTSVRLQPLAGDIFTMSEMSLAGACRFPSGVALQIFG
jgi:hypothetical protein